MKNYMIAVALILCTIAFTATAQEADSILGIWRSPHGNSNIRITKKGNNYFGYMLLPPKGAQEESNPEDPETGNEILKDFRYRSRGIYVGGKVVDIKSGKSYNGQMKLIDNDKLNVRIFFGIIQLGRTETWMRVSAAE